MKTGNAQLGVGTSGGMVLSVMAQLGAHDIVKTAVLAALGAVVSFAVTWALQQWRHHRRKQ